MDMKKTPQDIPAASSGGLTRYSVIHGKDPRETVMLRGRGCAWKRCRFCGYHLDSSKDEKANFTLNQA